MTSYPRKYLAINNLDLSFQRLNNSNNNPKMKPKIKVNAKKGKL